MTKRKKEDRSLKKKLDIQLIPRFIDETEVLTLTNKGWYIGGRKMTKEESDALRSEALEFRKSYLWQVMRRDIHYQAYLQSTNKRATEIDAVYGGAMYKCLEILEKFLENCETL